MTDGPYRLDAARQTGVVRQLVAGIALIVLVASCGVDQSAPAATTQPDQAATTVGPAVTAPATTRPAPTTTRETTATTTSLPDPLAPWRRLDADPATFGDVTITAGDSAGTRLVLGGCQQLDAAGFPMWWSDGAAAWTRADGPPDVRCITQVESSAFGFYAAGLGVQNQLHSADGVTWEQLDLSSDLGFDEPGQLGVVFAIFVSPAGDRVTLLYSHAAEGESRIATLLTTTDGETWTPGPAASAALFDSSDISAVIEGGPGLIAVGASPGGEFVPTAAVFTSPDGLDWTRVTGSDADFNDKVMTDVMAFESGYVAVGGDFFTTGLMTAWTSPDGVSWIRSPHPPEQTDPSVAHMTAQAVTIAGESIWAAGRDFDARRATDDGLPAIWASSDGVTWARADFEEARSTVPFEVVDAPDIRIGVWPPPFSLSRDPVLLFAGE